MNVPGICGIPGIDDSRSRDRAQLEQGGAAVLSTGADWAWLGVIAGAFLLFWSPVIVAAVRNIERMGLVVLLVLLALGTGGVTWFASWILVFGMPRRAEQSATWQPLGDRHYRP